MKIIETYIFSLRPWRETDLASLVKYADNAKIAKNMTNAFPHPYTVDDGREFLKMAVGNPGLRAVDVGGEAVGSIGIFPQSDIHERNAEMGYWLAEPFWGRGIMTRAVREMAAYGFATFPDVTRIFARPFSTNPASHRVLEKAGFTLEARLRDALYKNGAYMDDLIFAIRR
jgi:RimJ/RimL family protein N-acetyltransferase